MTSTYLIWALVPLVLVMVAFEFLAGFGTFLADKSSDERKDNHELRRAAWFGFLMASMAMLGPFVLSGLFGR